MISHPILSCYYTHVTSLGDYIFQTHADQAVDTTATNTEYNHFLTHTVVACNGRQSATANFRRVEITESFDEVLRRVQLQLLRRDAKDTNVLCLGFRLEDGLLCNKLSNTTVSAVQDSLHWLKLHGSTSSTFLTHLLRDTAVFESLENECLRQVCGRPLNTSRPLLMPQHHVTPSSCSATFDANRMLDRRNIYYANATGTSLRLSQRNVLRTLIGLPTMPLNHGNATQVSPQRLAKCIWPLEYGDAPQVYRQTLQQRLNDTVDPGIRTGKTPKRLLAVLPLLSQMIADCGSLDLTEIIGRTCPSTLRKQKLSTEDRQVLLAALTEDSQDIDSQDLNVSLLITHNSCSHAPGSTSSSAVQGDHNSCKRKRPNDSIVRPRFADFVIQHHQVVELCTECISRIVPSEIWGSIANEKRVAQAVKRWVCARRFETFSVREACDGIRLNDVSWSRLSGKKRRPTVSDIQKRRDLLGQLVAWIFEGLLTNLMRFSFYVTESSAYQKQTLYFLKSDWEAICQPLLENMTSTLFSRLSDAETKDVWSRGDRQLSASHVRLLPKEQGVRPIVNLSYKPANDDTFVQSINQILQTTFAILNAEKSMQDNSVGSAITTNEVHDRLLAYKSKLAGAQHPRLYMVKMDIRACFDNIDQSKLLELLERMLESDEYNLHKYAIVQHRRGRPFSRYARAACGDGDIFRFPSLSAELANEMRCSVFVDQVRMSRESRLRTLSLLREHVKENIVRFGPDYYRQIIGIPQGSILSTLLCNILLGDLERQRLAFLAQPDTLLLRVVDDFLLVTPRKQDATLFLHTMFEGHPDYGCFVAADKTLVNFDVASPDASIVAKVHNKQGFPWCGFLFDQHTLDVRYDYARLASSHIANSLTIASNRRPGDAFIAAMNQYVLEMNIDPVFFDTNLNSLRIVYLNLYQMLQLIAMRYHSYIAAWKPRLETNCMFFMRVVHLVVARTCRGLRYMKDRGGVELQIARPGGMIRFSIVKWLAYRAFHLILSRKPTRFHAILAHLKQLCISHNPSPSMYALKGVLADSSNAALSKIKF